MTLVVIASLVLGSVAILLHLVADEVFERVFGYIGASAVWLVSFGRIRIGPLEGRESPLAWHIGVVTTVVVVAAVCYIIQQP